MIDVNKQGEVWVFAEQHACMLEDVPVELLSKGRELADQLGVKLGAVLIGDGVSSLCEKLGHYGADKVYLVEKGPSIGGHMAQLDKTFPTNDCSM